MGNQQRLFYENKIYIKHPTYSNLYLSEDGLVYNIKTNKSAYTKINKKGYLELQISIDGKKKTLKVHRLVAEVFLEKPSEELLEKCKTHHWKTPCVKHLDNVKTNNHYTNLKWDTQIENNKDAWRDGIHKGLKGSLNGRALMTEELVRKVCLEFQNGAMPKEVSKKYGLSPQQATKLRAGISWKHIWKEFDIKVNRRSTTIENTSKGGSE